MEMRQEDRGSAKDYFAQEPARLACFRRQRTLSPCPKQNLQGEYGNLPSVRLHYDLHEGWGVGFVEECGGGRDVRILDFRLP